jgi:hypothetical protein
MAKKLAVDHWVKTADGAIGRVRYVGPQYSNGKFTDELYAEIAIDNNLDETIHLPVAELSRIANPNKKLVPIEGMPDKRPNCVFCDKPLRPLVKNTYDNHEARHYGKVTKRDFEGWQGYSIERGNQWDKFCTHGCALAFAAAAFKAGYRIVRKK